MPYAASFSASATTSQFEPVAISEPQMMPAEWVSRSWLVIGRCAERTENHGSTLGHRRVQVEQAALGQLQRQDGGERLADRADLKQRVVAGRPVASHRSVRSRSVTATVSAAAVPVSMMPAAWASSASVARSSIAQPTGAGG